MRHLPRTYSHLLIGMLLLPFPVCAQDSHVVICGDAPFAANEQIRVIGFNDLLNRRPVVLATAPVGHDGTFRLRFESRQIRNVQIAIRNARAELFTAPGKTYNLHVGMDTALFGMVDPEKYGGFLQVTADCADSGDLNRKLGRFTRFYEHALDQYAFALTVDKDRTAYDSVMSLLHARFPVRYNPSNFYESYLYYACGALDLLFYDKYPDTIYRRYFDNDYILYNNPAYMSLFYSTYTGYLYNSRYVSKDFLARAVNENPDYLTLFNETGRDPMLANERLRELVIILNVGEFYWNDAFDRQNILDLLRYIRDYTHFPEHAAIAENTLRGLESMGRPVGPLTMKDPKGRPVAFGDLPGKPVYVQVFQSDCVDCIREMSLLAGLYGLYGDSMEFVSLNIDADENRYKAFCKKYGGRFTWPILYFNKDYDWLAAFGIETLPDYFILDEKGLLAMREAPSPEKGLAGYLMRRFPKVEGKTENPLFMDREGGNGNN